MSMSQREGVLRAIVSICGEISGDMKEVVKGETLAQVLEVVTHSYLSGDISLRDTDSNREKLADPNKMRVYARGQINDALRKDKRLNGGVEYVAKKPGSRTAAGSPEIRELKKLKTAFIAANDEEKVRTVAERIRILEQEAADKKAKASQVDLSKVSPELLKKLGIAS